MMPALQFKSITPSALDKVRQFCPTPLGSPKLHGKYGAGWPALGPSVSTQLPSLAASDPDTQALRARRTQDRNWYSAAESMVARYAPMPFYVMLAAACCAAA